MHSKEISYRGCRASTGTVLFSHSESSLWNPLAIVPTTAALSYPVFENHQQRLQSETQVVPSFRCIDRSGNWGSECFEVHAIEMALRAVKLLAGEQYYCIPTKGVLLDTVVRQFTSSSRMMQEGVSGPGLATQSEGVTDMNSGNRESVTEGRESPRDVAESLKEHREAGKSDDAAGLKGEPGEQVDKQQVREDVAGTGAQKHSQVGTP